MKAIVLSYDKKRIFTEHMIQKYHALWPDNPFCFRIPYQELSGENKSNREYIQCPKDIKSTVLSLISDLDDNEWIYWCIDDKYPINFKLDEIQSIYYNLDYLKDNEISGILFCRCRNLMINKKLNHKKIYQNETTYLERKNYDQIWIHQFLKVKVLRYLFKQFPDKISSAKDMDYLKNKIVLPREQRLVVTKKNYAIFGESTHRGRITKNCYNSMIENGLINSSEFDQKIARGNIVGEFMLDNLGYSGEKLKSILAHIPWVRGKV